MPSGLASSGRKAPACARSRSMHCAAPRRRRSSEMASAIPFENRAGRRETIIVALIAFVVGILAGLVFMLFPGLDIAVSRWFLNENSRFWMARSDFWQGLRELFMHGFTIWYF